MNLCCLSNYIFSWTWNLKSIISTKSLQILSKIRSQLFKFDWKPKINFFIGNDSEKYDSFYFLLLYIYIYFTFRFCLPSVRELRFYGSFEISEVTQESIRRLLECVSEGFPNIDKWDISFWNRAPDALPSWRIAYAKMKEIQPEWFIGCPTKLKGELEFYAGVDQLDSDEVSFFIQ